MITPVDTELPSGIGIGALLDVLDVGPIDPYWNVVLGLTCHCAGMATNASLVVDYESVVHHNLCDEALTQNASVSPN